MTLHYITLRITLYDITNIMLYFREVSCALCKVCRKRFSLGG